MSPSRRRRAVEHVCRQSEVSERRACEVLGQPRSTQRYRAKIKDDVEAGSNWEPYLRRELPGIDLELAGVLDTRSIALADLLELRAGTVLPLAPPEVVRLQADGVTLGEGRYGTFEGMKEVQLARLGNLDRD